MNFEQQKIKLNNGDYFIGNIDQNKNYLGQGEYVYNIKQQSVKYVGNFKESQFNGLGLLIDKNGNKINGEFLDNKLNGQCHIIYSTGDEFKGQMQNNIKNGQGIIIYKNKQLIKYEGQFKNDMFNGKGRLDFQENNYYEGNFIDNLFEGEGKLFTQDYIYEGNFLNGKKQGFGIIRFKNNDVYEGEFVNDFIQGSGKYCYNDGSEYCGQFFHNLKNGQGFLTFNNNPSIEKYDGQFKDGKFEGEGKLFLKNNVIYKGNFSNNFIQGKGMLFFQGQQIIEAYFYQNQKHGEVKLSIFDQARQIIRNYSGRFSYDVEKIQYSDFGKPFQIFIFQYFNILLYIIFFVNYILFMIQKLRKIVKIRSIYLQKSFKFTSENNLYKLNVKLQNMLEKQYKINKEYLDQNDDIQFQVKQQGFEILDIEGYQYIELKKQIDNVEIIVQFKSRALRVDDESDESEDSENENENALEEKMQGKEGNDFQDYCYFTVFITKNNESIAYECITVDQELVVNNLVQLGGDIMNYKNQTKIERETYQYLGPDFSTLDSHLQNALTDYLRSYGINEQICYIVQQYSLEKEAKLFINWLKTMLLFIK